MEFKDLEQKAKEANLTIEQGFKALSNAVASVNQHKGKLKEEDYQTMLNEFERVKKLKKDLNERYSKQ